MPQTGGWRCTFAPRVKRTDCLKMAMERVRKGFRVKESLELDHEGQITVLKNGPMPYKAENLERGRESMVVLGCPALGN